MMFGTKEEELHGAGFTGASRPITIKRFRFSGKGGAAGLVGGLSQQHVRVSRWRNAPPHLSLKC